MSERAADGLVVFGITGDLAKKQTFRSLYRLERRGLLNPAIIGVAADDWSVDQLRDHARESITAAGEQLDEAVFARFASRLSYVSGDFADPQTYIRLASAIEQANVSYPAFYLETPPSLFAVVVAGLGNGKLLGDERRVGVEKPFGHDLRSAQELSVDLHKYLDESQLYRIDHFLGKMGLEEVLYLRFANTMLEPVWNRDYLAAVQVTMAETFGVEDRGHFYDPVGALRDVVVNHLMQVIAATAMEPPASSDPGLLSDAKFAVFQAMLDADPKRYVRGQYAGYREIPGVAPDSTTETYAALRLEIENWRWSGVPFFVRTGKRLPVTETEVRLLFRRPPEIRFLRFGNHRPEPNQIVFKIDPSAGIRMILDAHRADASGPREIFFDVEFAQEGGEDPTPYEVLLHAMMIGDRSYFTRQDSVEATWRVLQPLLDDPPPVRTYAPGTWGPPEADGLVDGYDPWSAPWIAS